jgi:hypothetical protein
MEEAGSDYDMVSVQMSSCDDGSASCVSSDLPTDSECSFYSEARGPLHERNLDELLSSKRPK